MDHEHAGGWQLALAHQHGLFLPLVGTKSWPDVPGPNLNRHFTQIGLLQTLLNFKSGTFPNASLSKNPFSDLTSTKNSPSLFPSWSRSIWSTWGSPRTTQHTYLHLRGIPHWSYSSEIEIDTLQCHIFMLPAPRRRNSTGTDSRPRKYQGHLF